MRSIEVEPPRPIEEGDDISGFRSGVEKVDAWLKDRAMGARSAGSAVVYVTLHKGRVVGYYSLSAQSITRKRAMGWLGRNSPDQIPVILLGMLGVDTAAYDGYEVSPYYDSMIAKIIVHGRDRTEAIAKMRTALEEMVVVGVNTNLDFQYAILENDTFAAGTADTSFIERFLKGEV